MTERYAILNEDWLLRGWTDVPGLLVNWKNGDQRTLSESTLYVANACDSTNDFNSLAFHPVHRALLDRLVEEGIARECNHGDPMDKRQLYRLAENPFLSTIQWSVTGLCNLNCRHCYMEAPSGRYGDPSFEDSVRMIGEFERANVLQVSLTGGEPFLRNDLQDIMLELASRKINVIRIYTNGVLLTKENLDQISSMGFRPSFQISFDGIGAHEYMRGVPGIEKTVIDSMREIKEAGFDLVISTSIDRNCLDCLPDTFELLRKLNIQVWRLSAPQERGNWRGSTTNLSLDEEAQAYFKLLRLWLDDGKPFSVEFGGFFRGAGRDVTVPDLNSNQLLTPDSYDCGVCRESPYLMPDGVLLPCPGYADTDIQQQMPNAQKIGLTEALNNPAFRSVVDRKKKDLLPENEECLDCQWFTECGMGCRAVAYARTGSILSRDPVSCEIWKDGYWKRFQELVNG